MDCDQILKNLRQICGIDPQRPVLAGISGGPDSICLLDLLHRFEINTIAAHLDHSLRSESASEADFVARKCAEYEIPFVSKKIDVAEFSKQKSLAIEEAARELRYEFLFEEAQKAGAQAVMVAHHADDQVETILMHLMRGSGLSGLAGMRLLLLPNPWSKTIPLIRPLLYTWRDEIIDYCHHRGLDFVRDQSNLDTRFYRNRIRHELIPMLQTYNPQIKQRLQKASEVIGSEEDFLQSMVEEAFDDVMVQKKERFIEFKRDRMKVLHPALIRRIVRKSIFMLNQSLRDVDFDTVERGVNFIRELNRSNQEVLCAGLSIFSGFHDRLVIAFDDDPLLDLWPQLMTRSQLPLPTHGAIRINEKWIVSTQEVDKWKPVNDPFVCQIDIGQLTKKLVINTVQPGDRFMPYGMNGKVKKLSDFWTNEGLPSRARKLWPLVRSGDQIIWVPGFRIAETVKVTKATKHILQIEVKNNDPAG